MDSIDRAIVEALKRNSRMSASEIGRQVKLSIPAVSERIRKLEEGGVIEGYTVKLNRTRMGWSLLAYVFVTLGDPERAQPFREAMAECPAVLECHHVAGEYDYLLKVLVEDTQALESFIGDSLKRGQGVRKSNTVIILSSSKESMNR
ncbi:Lrp/AsnC family transcriptional regulator [Gorillibacterium sp. sgz500922]|uniref:Lrp/AsnC family transcriptional regulator n=1 Tax=Gorillibacterium sp. sgz500922 TaxID=3446694 RepID=UPI003F67EA60